MQVTLQTAMRVTPAHAQQRLRGYLATGGLRSESSQSWPDWPGLPAADQECRPHRRAGRSARPPGPAAPYNRATHQLWLWGVSEALPEGERMPWFSRFTEPATRHWRGWLPGGFKTGVPLPLGVPVPDDSLDPGPNSFRAASCSRRIHPSLATRELPGHTVRRKEMISLEENQGPEKEWL